jgi:hypothetical protein
MTKHYAIEAAEIIANGIKWAGEGLESEIGKNPPRDYHYELDQIAGALNAIADAIDKLAGSK